MLRSSKSLSAQRDQGCIQITGAVLACRQNISEQFQIIGLRCAHKSCLFMYRIKIFFSYLYLLKQSEHLDQLNRILHSFPLAVSFVRYIRFCINPVFVLFWGASSGSIREQVAIYNIFKSGMDKIAVIWYWHIKVTERHGWKPPEQDGSRCLRNGTVPAEGDSACLSVLRVFFLFKMSYFW